MNPGSPGVPATSGGSGDQATAVRAVLSLGSNLGDRLAALQGAVDALEEHDSVRIIAVSRVYETRPVGGPPQDPYLNAVVLIETTLRPGAVLELAQQIEEAYGRVRLERWGPRTLDVDVIVVDDIVSADPRLTLPHPRAHERAFVLVPWLEIDPSAVVPGEGPVAELLSGLDTSGVALLSTGLVRL